MQTTKFLDEQLMTIVQNINWKNNLSISIAREQMAKITIMYANKMKGEKLTDFVTHCNRTVNYWNMVVTKVNNMKLPLGIKPVTDLKEITLTYIRRGHVGWNVFPMRQEQTPDLFAVFDSQSSLDG